MTKKFSRLQLLLLVVALLNLSSLVVIAQPQSVQAVTANVVAAVAPSYPAARGQFKSEEYVWVEILIENDGSVKGARASGGHPVFYRASEAAARRWKFTAGEGDQGQRKGHLKFVYRLLPWGTPEAELGSTFITPNQVEVRVLQYPSASSASARPIRKRRR